MALIRPQAPGVGTRISPATVPAKKKVKLPALAPTRAVTINPTIPTFTPGALSSAAQKLLGQLEQQRAAAAGPNGSIDFERAQGLADIERRRMQGIYNRDTGLESADSNAAGRGIYNSGIRLKNRSDVQNQSDIEMSNLQAAGAALQSQWERARNAAELQYQQGKTDLINDDTEQQKLDFMANQPLPPAPKTATVFTFPQWLEYHRRAGTALPTGTALRNRYNLYVQNQSRLLAR